MYLVTFTGENLKQWVNWISWAENCYNTGCHTSLKGTPFKIVHGHCPPRLLSYHSGTAKLEAVEEALMERDQVWQVLCQRLMAAQEHMKFQYDKKHRDVSSTPGDWVLFKLQPYKQTSISQKCRQKLAPHFMDPFK